MKITDAGKVVMAGFAGTRVDEQVRELLKLGVSGFILFARNIESSEQTKELIAEIRSLAAGRRLLFAVDQEGGRVARLREPATIWPSMRMLGNTGDLDAAGQFGKALGFELAALGFDLDFAPVVDVDSNSDNPVIGDRSFGNNPQRVAEMGVAVITGLQNAGVAACAKHFPGHGDADKDSHRELPLIPHDRRRLDNVELPPFVAAVEAKVAAVMTAHILVEAIDAQWPATMSAKVLSILREDLAFDGVIVTDDLEMKAIADNYDVGEAAVRAAAAGADLMLACKDFHHQENVVRALFDGHMSGKLPPLRLDEMQRRLEKMALRFPPTAGDLSVLGRDEHQQLAELIRSRGA